MVTLSSDWQTLASANFTNPYNITMSLQARCTQDTSANKSHVYTRFVVKNTVGSLSADTYSIGLTGAADYSGTNLYIGVATYILRTGDFEVTHNANGTATTIVDCWYTASFGPTWNPDWVTVNLPTINRTPTAPTSCTASAGNGNYVAIGEPITVTYSGATGTITGYEMQRCINGGSWVAITSPDTLLYDIKSGSSVKYRVRVKNGSLASGWKESNTLYVSGKMKTKVNGSWVNGSPWIKVNGSWVRVKRVYIKVNGAWKQSV